MKVADVIRLLHDDGWFLVTTRGSHRQFKHESKSGHRTRASRVTTSPRHFEQHSQTSRAQEVRLNCATPIVIEKAGNNYSAYVPDLTGCIATGATVEETEAEIREAIEFHLEGMREDGLPIPQPSSHVDYVDVAANRVSSAPADTRPLPRGGAPSRRPCCA